MDEEKTAFADLIMGSNAASAAGPVPAGTADAPAGAPADAAPGFAAKTVAGPVTVSPDAKAPAASAGRVSAGDSPTPASAPEGLREELESARARVEELERERFLLLQGVAEEDLDYCVYRIGRLVTPEKPFPVAAKDFLREHRARRGGTGFRTGGSLSGSAGAKPSASPSDMMNALIRGH